MSMNKIFMIGALEAASILIIVATTTVVETAVDKSSSNFGLLSTSPNNDAAVADSLATGLCCRR